MQLVGIPLRIVLVLAVVSSVTAVALYSVVLDEWEDFKVEHGKVYTSDTEEAFRRKVWMDNKYFIAHHNQKYYNEESSFKLRMNHFGDMLHHEFVSTMNGYGGLRTSDDLRDSSLFIEPDDSVIMPDSVDWREKGAVTPVKNQGACGSCWAFSSTGALEGQHFRKTGELTSLSEQNLVDCSQHYGNHGCHGGWMDSAFKYVRDNHGIDTEESYPYEHVDRQCRFNNSTIGADDVGYMDIRRGSEDAVKKAIATVGPVSIAIDAAVRTFMHYHTGVYNDTDCNPHKLDHGVLAVGYGVTEDGVDYWLVKNSWGPHWGDNGYIKIARNQGNICGVASAASFPLV
ncbi:unnamed protein product [Meganyctiphanes norvegica]|uniref:Cathepsin L n=1 Tax=Meganyctiphanes norvegica TaxID=48144 RepID=A0AAV2RRP7_MEGNR